MDALSQKLMQEAAVCLEDGDDEEALRIYERILELDEINIDVRQSQIRLLIDKQRVEDAISALKKLLELRPKNANAHWSLARQLHKFGLDEQAIESYTKAIEFDPKRSLYFFQRAHLLKSIGRNSEAFSDLKSAIDLEPGNIKYQNHYSRLAQEQSGSLPVNVMFPPSSKRRVAVHVGAPKTGTTWLQSLLAHNKSQLRKKNISIILRKEAYDFIDETRRSLTDNTGVCNSLNLLSSRAAAEDDVIVSEEDLSGNLGLENPTATATAMCGEISHWINAIKEEFGAADLHFYMTVRSYKEMFDSGYIQLLKMGRDLSVGDFRKNLNVFNLSWIPTVSMFLETIGEAKLTVFEYDRAVNRRLTDAIEKFIGPLDLEMPKTQKRNRRYSDNSIRIAQLGNPILDREGKLELRRLLETHVVNDPNYSFSLFTPEETVRLDERYEADIARIKAMAGQRLAFSEADNLQC